MQKYKTKHKDSKLKIIAPIWNGEFELPGLSHTVSDIQGYIEYIIIKHETLPIDPPINSNINRINNKLVFRIKDGYKLELQKQETMKLFFYTRN